MRMKEASAASRAHALTAAILAVSMMATVALTALIPVCSAKADDTLADGAIFVPSNISMGDNGTSVNDVDTGLATFVGRDFYVGKPKDGDRQSLTADSIDGSWAAEMEGQTFVRGRYMQRAQKGFFTIGTVAFGAQYQPANGSTILAVEGTNSAFDNSVQSIVQAWPSTITGTSTQGGGILQVRRNNEWSNFSTKLAGSRTKVWGTANNDDTIKLRSIYQYGYSNTNDSDAQWNIKDFSTVKDGQGNSIDIYGTKVTNDSATQKSWTSNGTVVSGFAPAQSEYVRKKYDYDKYDAFAKNETEKNNGKRTWAAGRGAETSFSTYKASMDFAQDSERLLTFTGDGTSSLQIFEVSASLLNVNNDKGLDFWFRNIPENASILINVVDDTTGANTPIVMRTGWRFWYGGTASSDISDGNVYEISNGYVTGSDSQTESALYSKVAQKIMWNFADASSVTIMGGTTQNASNVNLTKLHADRANDWYTQETSMSGSSVTDDPAAAMLGSIMVPNGSFESHVTTNGRVYVGQDFMMYNPTQATMNGTLAKTASIIDMDQERHNFPWTASYNPQGVRIKWNKVDSDGNKLKAGTTWAVYGSLSAATSADPTVKPLATVGDNIANDADSTVGVIEPMTDLNPNSTYYIKETGTIEGYVQNTNIYRIVAGEAGGTYSTIDKVYNSAGIEITDNDSRLLHLNTGIVNKASGTAVEWKKTDAEQDSATLTGSTWQLKATSGSDANKTWTIDDNRVKVTKVTVNGGADVSMESSTTQTVAATVLPEGTPQSVTWSSTAPDVASVTAGTITALTKGKTTIRACSTSDASVCGSITVTVTGPEVAALSVTNESGKNESRIAVVSVADESNQQLEPVTYLLAKSADPMLASSDNTVDCSNDGHRCDVNSNPGEFKIEDVADGDYELTETTAPDGYDKSDETYRFTVANGQVTWTNPSGVTSGTIALIVNTRKTGSVTWNKVSSEASDTKLGGSEWKLTQLSTWNAAISQYEKLPNGVEHAIADCVENCGTDSFHDIASGKGEFNVTGLPWGEYQLIETKAPDGFNLTNTVTTFTIGPNNGSVSLSVDGGNIANTPGVTLPEAGGDGDMKIYAAGLLAAVVAIMAGLLALKAKERQQ
ncbi:SpaA isopeptide-forming pilin-related protein [Bifidobacterium dentium]|uniref:SpaA isopeptide-forming pilin-related protein n=1 Tax=Bifidobacterium dentium TaxID=1689 RepID=UPI001F50E3E4|nr:SpaA isopeptide-forming pilin-related protein [Bifidobacterium dentium]